MQAISSKVSKGLDIGSELTCGDNSGAKILKILSVKGYRGKRRRRAKAGVGDVVVCSVVKGNEKMRRKVVEAVVVRQAKYFRRPAGQRVRFEDNAAVLLKEGKLPQATEIKGAIAKEVGERFPKVSSIAKIVV